MILKNFRGKFMKGLDLALNYYNQFGKPMLESDFADVFNKLAVGLVGEGSECFGYDDKTSTDHDFDMGFCIFITQRDYDDFGFKLERAYAKLPNEFMGYKRQLINPVGGNRRGVIVIEDFYKKFLGTPTIPQDNSWWFFVPSHSLANASNGKVFIDGKGAFSSVREVLLKGYPQDIRLKKIASHLVLAGQSGQYNYSRCILHDERGASSLAMYEFVKHIISIIYLLNNKYQPFYKWTFRGLRDLSILSECETALEGLLEYGNGKDEFNLKCEIVEDISRMVIEELKKQNLTNATCNNLETHAYSVTDKIIDNSIRNMHIMDGI